MSKVRRTIATNKFERGVKQIKSRHQTSVLEELKDTITKLENFEITSSKSNHPLRNANKMRDIHLSGGAYVLVYRYDNDVLYVDLRLHDVVRHNDLDNVDYKDKETHDFDKNSII